MSEYTLNYHVRFQADATNVKSELDKVRNSTKPIDVKANVDSKSLADIKSLKTAIDGAANSVERFGERVGLAFQRFGAFMVATTGVFAFIGAVKNAAKEALQFDTSLNKLIQVSDEYQTSVRSLANDVMKLSINLGVSSKEVLSTAVTFKQAGLTIEETRKAMKAIAETSLAPNFDSMKQTTEGAIASFQQFGKSADNLRNQLGAMNAVAGAFATEASDLIVATQKAGGAFSSLGGSLEEMIALFTSVRSTTRESAESIATGMRTIFSRLQRNDTVEALKDLNINLRHTREEAEDLGNLKLADKFIGGYEAIKRIATALKDLPETDSRFSNVVEQLGGYRQISRVIPLIKQFEETQKALNVARMGGVALDINTEQSQKRLEVRITRIKESYQALFNEISQSDAFQKMAVSVEFLATSLAKALEHAGPLVKVLGSLTLGLGAKYASSFINGVSHPESFHPFASRPMQSGTTGPVARKSSGGPVMGAGNGDSVPHLLEPGEFVMPKQAARRVGYGNLQRMAFGGEPSKNWTTNYNQNYSIPLYDINNNIEGGVPLNGIGRIGLQKLQKRYAKIDEYNNMQQYRRVGGAQRTRTRTLEDETELTALEEVLNPVMVYGISSGKMPKFGVSSRNTKYKNANDDMHLFGIQNDEISISRLTDDKYRIGENYVFARYKIEKRDRERRVRRETGFGFGGTGPRMGDNNIGFHMDYVPDVGFPDIDNKVKSGDGATSGFGSTAKRLGVKRLSSGGNVEGKGIGDHVPALLEPGEFVIPRRAAENIGYANLHKMISKRMSNGGEVSDDFKYLEGMKFDGKKPSVMSKLKLSQEDVEDHIKKITGSFVKGTGFAGVPGNQLQSMWNKDSSSVSGNIEGMIGAYYSQNITPEISALIKDLKDQGLKIGAIRDRVKKDAEKFLMQAIGFETRATTEKTSKLSDNTSPLGTNMLDEVTTSAIPSHHKPVDMRTGVGAPALKVLMEEFTRKLLLNPDLTPRHDSGFLGKSKEEMTELFTSSASKHGVLKDSLELETKSLTKVESVKAWIQELAELERHLSRLNRVTHENNMSMGNHSAHVDAYKATLNNTQSSWRGQEQYILTPEATKRRMSDMLMFPSAPGNIGPSLGQSDAYKADLARRAAPYGPDKIGLLQAKAGALSSGDTEMLALISAMMGAKFQPGMGGAYSLSDKMKFGGMDISPNISDVSVLGRMAKWTSERKVPSLQTEQSAFENKLMNDYLTGVSNRQMIDPNAWKNGQKEAEKIRMEADKKARWEEGLPPRSSVGGKTGFYDSLADKRGIKKPVLGELVPITTTTQAPPFDFGKERKESWISKAGRWFMGMDTPVDIAMHRFGKNLGIPLTQFGLTPDKIQLNQELKKDNWLGSYNRRDGIKLGKNLGLNRTEVMAHEIGHWIDLDKKTGTNTSLSKSSGKIIELQKLHDKKDGIYDSWMGQDPKYKYSAKESTAEFLKRMMQGQDPINETEAKLRETLRKELDKKFRPQTSTTVTDTYLTDEGRAKKAVEIAKRNEVINKALGLGASRDDTQIPKQTYSIFDPTAAMAAKRGTANDIIVKGELDKIVKSSTSLMDRVNQLVDKETAGKSYSQQTYGKMFIDESGKLQTGGGKTTEIFGKELRSLKEGIFQQLRSTGFSGKEALLTAKELANRAVIDPEGMKTYTKGGRSYLTAESFARIERNDVADKIIARMAGNVAAGNLAGDGMVKPGFFGGLIDRARLWRDKRGPLMQGVMSTQGLGLGLSIGASYLGNAISPNAELGRQMGTGDEGATSRYRTKRVAGGALEGAAMGAGFGMAFGPKGGLVGAGLGAIYGGVNSISSANSEIRDARTGNASENIATQLGMVYRGIKKHSDINSKEFINNISTVQVHSDIAARKSGDWLFGAFNDQTSQERSAAYKKELRLNAGNNLFSMYNMLSSQSSDLGKSLAGGERMTAEEAGKKLKASDNKVLSSISLLTDLGVYKNTSEALKQLGEEVLKAKKAEEEKLKFEQNNVNRERILTSFGRFADIVEQAANSTALFENKLSIISGSGGQLRNFGNVFSSFGANSQSDLSAAGSIFNNLGMSSLTNSMFGNEKFSNILPSALSSLTHNKEISQEEQLRALLLRSLGASSIKELSKSDADILNSITAEFSNIVDKEHGLSKAQKSDVTGLSKKLMTPTQSAMSGYGQKILADELRMSGIMSSGIGQALSFGSSAIGNRAEASGILTQAMVAQNQFSGRGLSGISASQLNSSFNERQSLLGAGRMSSGQIVSRIGELQGLISKADDDRGQTSRGSVAFIAAEKKFQSLVMESNRLEQALKHLGNAAEKTAGIQQKLADVNSSVDARRSYAEQFFMASPGERARMTAQQSDIKGIAEDRIDFSKLDIGRQREVISSLGPMGNMKLPTGQTASDLKNKLLDMIIGDLTPGEGIHKKETNEKEQLEKEYVQALKDAALAQLDAAGLAETRQEKFFSELSKMFDKFLSGIKVGNMKKELADLENTEAQKLFEKGDLNKDIDARKFLQGFGANDSNMKIIRNEMKNAPGLMDITSRINRLSAINTGDLTLSDNISADVSKNVSKISKSFAPHKTYSQIYEEVLRPNINTGFLNGLDESDKNKFHDSMADFVKNHSGVIKATRSGKQEDIDNLRNFLGHHISNFKKSQLENVGAEREKFINENMPVVGADRGKIISATDTDDKIKEINDALGRFNNGKSLEGIDDKLKRLQKELDDTANKIVEIRLKLSSPDINKGQAMVPRGTDTVPAMLSPGEVVVSRNNAQSNKGILSAINSGEKVQYLSAGGEIPDNSQPNLGDVVNENDLPFILGNAKKEIKLERIKKMEAIAAAKAAKEQKIRDGFGEKAIRGFAKENRFGKLERLLRGNKNKTKDLREDSNAAIKDEMKDFNLMSLASIAYSGPEMDSAQAGIFQDAYASRFARNRGMGMEDGVIGINRHQARDKYSRRLKEEMIGNAAAKIGRAVGGLGKKRGGYSRPLELIALDAFQRRATGGPVQGIGSGDRIPMLLEPGEFVMNKSATQNIGQGKLNQINSGIGVNNSGGDNKLAQAMMDFNAKVGQMGSMFNNFSTSVDKLVSVMEKFPTSIEMNGNVTHTHIHNGAEVFGEMKEMFAKEAERIANEAIDQRVPEATSRRA